MSWISIAAGFLRDAMNSPAETSAPAPDPTPPANIAEVMGILNQHRSEIDRNFEAVAQLLNAQKAQHLKAMQIQRRWNYALTAALLILVSAGAAIYWTR